MIARNGALGDRERGLRFHRAAGAAHFSGVRRIDFPAGRATRMVPSLAARG